MIYIICKHINKLIGYGGILLVCKILKCRNLNNKKKILHVLGILSSLAFYGKVRSKALIPISSTLFGINNPRI